MRAALLVLVLPPSVLAQARPISVGPHLLSVGGVREWSEPAGVTSEPELDLRFEAPSPNGAAHTLALRQTGVRRTWVVELNGSEIGRLYPDENPHRVFFSVPEGAVRAGENRLRVAPLDTLPDDVELAAIELLATPREALLGASTLAVTVLAGCSSGGGSDGSTAEVDPHPFCVAFARHYGTVQGNCVNNGCVC